MTYDKYAENCGKLFAPIEKGNYQIGMRKLYFTCPQTYLS